MLDHSTECCIRCNIYAVRSILTREWDTVLDVDEQLNIVASYLRVERVYGCNEALGDKD